MEVILIKKLHLLQTHMIGLKLLFFNTEIEQTCRQYFDIQVYCQGYKDKGFNIKLKIKRRG